MRPLLVTATLAVEYVRMRAVLPSRICERKNICDTNLIAWTLPKTGCSLQARSCFPKHHAIPVKPLGLSRQDYIYCSKQEQSCKLFGDYRSIQGFFCPNTFAYIIGKFNRIGQSVVYSTRCDCCIQ